MPAIPAVHVAMASPSRRRRATQRAQSALHVPVHQHTSSPCTSCTSPRHPEAVTMPLRPSRPTHHNLPTKHRFPRSFSETGAVSRDSTSHRHHLLAPWTQRIVPPCTATHDGQSSPTRCTLDRVHPFSYKPKRPSGTLPFLPFSPSPFSLTSPVTLPGSRRNATTEARRSCGRSTAVGEVAVDRTPATPSALL
jgi:hypothetical protein